ncbi:MAG: hypothetical protein HY670_00635 [Chloroflexi bacterium]|nr:hypothetical protein [Chloroflexota bacterium]
MPKKWETREWWENRPWPQDEVEQMVKEELDRLKAQPWFEQGKPCKTDIFHKRSWREEFEAIWGKWGCHGIGKLKKVALSLPHEYELNPVFEKEPAYYRLYKNRLPDIDKVRKMYEKYASLLESEGVQVFWLDPPPSPLGPYGFMRSFSTPGLTATKAGMILTRMGRAGCFADVYARWWSQELPRIGCPIYHMMLEVAEMTPIYLGENAVVLADGYPTSEAGALEYQHLLEKLGDEVWMAHNPGYVERWGFPAGGTSHLDMVLGIADLGLAICYPSFIDYRTIAYLRSKKIRFVEVPPEEFVEYGVNTLALEPGKVIISAGARETIKALRGEGVECLDFDFSENAAGGIGGPDCITAKLYREPGPSLADL